MRVKTFSNIKNIGMKAFACLPMGIMAKKMGIAGDKIKNIFMPKGEQTVNLTELTDKTIQENRASADAKTQKQVDVAAGTGAALAAAGSSAPPYQQEGGALAQPEIIESPYIDVYKYFRNSNVSQHTVNSQLVRFLIADYPPIGVNRIVYEIY